MRDLESKVTLVTGSTGIGKATPSVLRQAVRTSWLPSVPVLPRVSRGALCLMKSQPRRRNFVVAQVLSGLYQASNLPCWSSTGLCHAQLGVDELSVLRRSCNWYQQEQKECCASGKNHTFKYFCIRFTYLPPPRSLQWPDGLYDLRFVSSRRHFNTTWKSRYRWSRSRLRSAEQLGDDRALCFSSLQACAVRF
jgi:hypothetical protein